MLKVSLLLLACDAAFGFICYPSLRQNSLLPVHLVPRHKAPNAALPPLQFAFVSRSGSALCRVTSVTRAEAVLLLTSFWLFRVLLKKWYLRQMAKRSELAPVANVERSLTMGEAFKELGVALGGASMAAAEAAADELGRVAPMSGLRPEGDASIRSSAVASLRVRRIL